MKRQQEIMGMPVAIEITDEFVKTEDIEQIFSYFREIDNKFSPYKATSEVERFNRHELPIENVSQEMKRILSLADEANRETNGYFTVMVHGRFDPSGLVKGYAIWKGAKKLYRKGYRNFYVEIGGDIQTEGLNSQGKKWHVGIRNPFKTDEIIKIVLLSGQGIATSGTYLRGSHIFNPIASTTASSIASMTVIGKNVYEADRFATAAFAMGEEGIAFIESRNDLEGYMITNNERAYYTSGFDRYIIN